MGSDLSKVIKTHNLSPIYSGLAETTQLPLSLAEKKTFGGLQGFVKIISKQLGLFLLNFKIHLLVAHL